MEILLNNDYEKSRRAMLGDAYDAILFLQYDFNKELEKFGYRKDEIKTAINNLIRYLELTEKELTYLRRGIDEINFIKEIYK